MKGHRNEEGEALAGRGKLLSDTVVYSTGRKRGGTEHRGTERIEEGKRPREKERTNAAGLGEDGKEKTMKET